MVFRAAERVQIEEGDDADEISKCIAAGNSKRFQRAEQANNKESAYTKRLKYG